MHTYLWVYINIFYKQRAYISTHSIILQMNFNLAVLFGFVTPAMTVISIHHFTTRPFLYPEPKTLHALNSENNTNLQHEITVLYVPMSSTEKKADMLTDVVERGCSDLYHTGWTILLASTVWLCWWIVHTGEFLTTIGLDFSKLCLRELAIDNHWYKRASIYKKLKIGLLASLICFGHPFFKQYIFCCYKLFYILSSHYQ